MPAPVLDRLGIRPIADEVFHLPDGGTIRRRKGIALFRYGDRVGSADVVFGEDGDAVLLGAFTLEALGLALDPLHRELRPLPMILAGSPRPGAALTGDRPPGSGVRTRAAGLTTFAKASAVRPSFTRRRNSGTTRTGRGPAEAGPHDFD